MTLTRETLAALQTGYVPAEALPGVLDGWGGPVEGPNPLADFYGVVGAPLHVVDYLDGTTHKGKLSTYGGRLWMSDAIRLPLSRPEARQRVAVVMGRGVVCDCGYDPAENGRETGLGWESDPPPPCCDILAAGPPHACSADPDDVCPDCSRLGEGPTPKYVRCDWCGGTGDGPPVVGSDGPSYASCSGCNGTGWVKSDEQPPTVDPAAEERAAIVAWLRHGDASDRQSVAYRESVGAIRDELANAIERGEYRKERAK